MELDKYTDGKPLLKEIDEWTRVNSDEADMAYFTILWLIGSGYITATPHNSGGYWYGFDEAVLTAKGLETLKAIPDSLTTPLGERLKEAVKQGGWEATRTLVSQVLSVGATIGINALK